MSFIYGGGLRIAAVLVDKTSTIQLAPVMLK
jgi:hypothetical protein